MKKLSVVIISIPILYFTYLSTIIWQSDAEELFGIYLYEDNSIKSLASTYYLKFIDYSSLKNKRLFKDKTLLESALSMKSIRSQEHSKIYDLLEILISKGEDVNLITKSECNWFDNLIIEGDINAINYLLGKGYKIPLNSRCKEEFKDLLEKFRLRYTNQEYELLKSYIN